MTTTTIIAGAGISGIRAALSLAELGHKVCLIDKAPSAGGILSKLDHQFPDNHCGMCQILPTIDRQKGEQFCLRKGVFHENIEFVSTAEIKTVKGSAGQFTVEITKKPTGVDLQKCTGCGDCEAVCPVSVGDDFNANFSQRKAIYLPVPYQAPDNRVIDFKNCTRCGECLNVCSDGAIDLEGTAQTLTYKNVLSVILATGVGTYDPSETDVYGFGHLPNVVTSTGFERIISSSGPYKGKCIRPSDSKEVKKIAWLQCVGSRNIMTGADHCSSVCCMFAVKEAVFACETIGKDADTAIFYMDMRTYGRDFQRYRDEAEQKNGVRFIRCRAHSIEPFENTGDLRVSYVNDKGRLIDEVFDLVVLSTGRQQGLTHPDFTAIEGVFTINKSLEFKDIAESIIGADAAAVRVNNLLTAPVFEKETVESDSAINSRQITQNALIIGAGPAGLSSAVSIADSGIHVDVIEKLGRIGGNYPDIGQGATKETVSKLTETAAAHQNITIHLESELISTSGRAGSFVSTLKSSAGETMLPHGATIIATGGRAAEMTTVSIEQNEKILSVFDLVKRIAADDFKSQKLQCVAMIQCAGTREEPRNYCSRVCCVKTLENSIKLKEIHPDARVYIFYRDIMTYGESEKMYTEARKKGVLFIPYEKSQRPDVSVNGETIALTCFDPVLGETMSLTPDLLSLATGIVPSQDDNLADSLELKLTQDGFIKEVNSKWRPVDTGQEGVFVCGLARAPQRADEAMDEGRAAAVRALRILNHKEIASSENSAVVRHALCTRCGLCIEACYCDARYVDTKNGRIVVDPVSCQGCGSCAVVCPNSATVIGTFEDHAIMEEIETFL